MLGSNDIDTIYFTRDTDTNSDIYDTYEDLYLNKKELEEKLLQAYNWPMVKGTCGCKKDRWHGTNSDNAGKRDQKNFR